MSDQLVAEPATYTTHNKSNKAGFEPPIPGIKPLKTCVIDRRDTVIRNNKYKCPFFLDAEVEISNAVRWAVLKNSVTTPSLCTLSFFFFFFDLWIL